MNEIYAAVVVINDINPTEEQADKIVTRDVNPIEKQNLAVRNPSIPLLSRLGLGLGLASL